MGDAIGAEVKPPSRRSCFENRPVRDMNCVTGCLFMPRGVGGSWPFPARIPMAGRLRSLLLSFARRQGTREHAIDVLTTRACEGAFDFSTRSLLLLS